LQGNLQAVNLSGKRKQTGDAGKNRIHLRQNYFQYKPPPFSESVKSIGMKEEKEIVRRQLKDERESLLERLEKWLETPLLILGFVWLALLIY
jgi:hypothetical protein